MNEQNDSVEMDNLEIDNETEAISGEGESGHNNPWRGPILFITWGFTLISFTLNFLFLQYILPTIGAVFMYLGFRSLRRSNRWFFAAWIIAAMKLIWQIGHLTVSVTPMITLINQNIVIRIIVISLQIALLAVYRNALRIVYRRIGITPARDPVLLAIIWTILIAVFAFLPFVNHWLVILPLIIFFIIVVRSLHQVGDELDQAASAFINAPSKVSNKILAWGYLISCLIFVAVFCTISNHLRLEESEKIESTGSETRTALIELGFPEMILLDLTDYDVTKLHGAIHIESSSDSLMFDPVKVSTKTGENSYTISNKAGNCNLQATTIYIEFPDNLLYVLVYFDWEDSKAYWQDGFTIWGEKNFELLNGILLYEKNGVEYTAPIPRLSCENVTTYNFFGVNESRQISGAVSYPYASENQRGYVFYRIQLPAEQWLGCNCFNYLHNHHPFKLPYVETEKQLLHGNLFNNNMQQHYTNFELQAYRDANGDGNRKGESDVK